MTLPAAASLVHPCALFCVLGGDKDMAKKSVCLCVNAMWNIINGVYFCPSTSLSL